MEVSDLLRDITHKHMAERLTVPEQFSDALSLERVNCIHGLALKVGVLDRPWGVDRMMQLYGDGTCYSLEYAEKTFRQSRVKTVGLYNQLMFVYSRSAPEKAEDLFKEMVKEGFFPTAETFRALIAAFSQGFKPEKACEYFILMKERYRLIPNRIHYGALVDAFARTATPENLSSAIEIVKGVPQAKNEYSVNTILNRCVPPQFPSKEDLLKLEKVIPIAQEFVNYLDEIGFKYGVLEKTHWRLERRGMKWPKSVFIE